MCCSDKLNLQPMSNVSTYGTDLQGLIREDFGLIVTAKE